MNTLQYITDHIFNAGNFNEPPTWPALLDKERDMVAQTEKQQDSLLSCHSPRIHIVDLWRQKKTIKRYTDIVIRSQEENGEA